MEDEALHHQRNSFDIEGERNLYRLQARRTPMRSFRKSVEDMPSWLQKPSSFYILHVTYFLLLGFGSAFAFWICTDENSERMSFVDALYCATSAVTLTGLLSVRIQGLHKFQQTVILLLTVLGSQIFISLLPLYARRLAYRRILTNQATSILSKLQDNKFVSDEHGNECDLFKSEAKESSAAGNENIVEVKVIPVESADQLKELIAVVKREGNYESRGIRKLLKHLVKLMWRLAVQKCSEIREIMMVVWSRCIRRKDCMTVLWRRISGGCKSEESSLATEISLWESKYVEYKALTYLYRIVVAYFLIVQIGGIVLIQLYLCASPTASRILEKNDVNKAFFAVYNSLTSFGNTGLTLLDNSMIPFRNHTFVLILLSFIILLGNTMFAPSLWLIISLLQRFASGRRKEIYTYLLMNPRKCYTHLFPKDQTTWLMATVMGFNTTQTLFFCILDWNSSAMDGLNPAEKVVAGMFQSAATRNAGSNVVNLTDLSPPMLVFIVCMMYISVYPVYLTRQKTRALKRVGRESSNSDEEYDSQISVQARKLLARDSAHLFIIVFFVCILESNNISHDPLNYSIFNIIFEVISGFGNVGLSMGYNCAFAKTENLSCKDVPYSLSGKWNSGGKLLIVITMFLGRHRGLPDSLDSALLVPRTISNDEELYAFNSPALWSMRSGDQSGRDSFSERKTVARGFQSSDSPQPHD